MPCCLLADFDDVVRAGHVYGHGFLTVNMLSRGNDGLQVVRVEVRRRGDENKVYFLRLRDLLIRIRTLEELGRVNGGVALRLLQLVEVLAPFFQLVGKQIGDGGHARTGILHEARRFFRRPPSAAENSEANLRIRFRPAHSLRLDNHKACCRGCPQKLPPPQLCILFNAHLLSSFKSQI